MKHRIYILQTMLVISLLLLTACDRSKGISDPFVQPNEAPTANAGVDKAVDEQTQVTLEGSATDSDGTVASYRWVQLSGPAVTLSDINVAQPTFLAPVTGQSVVMEFELTVADDDGEETSDQVVVTVNPTLEISFTIEGQVVGGDVILADAAVKVDVGDLSFDTTTDAEGKYSVLVEADEAYNSELLVLSATGTGVQSFVKLVSAGFTAQELVAVAGDDAVIDAAEYVGVNISNMTTAMVGMAQAANSSVFPTTKAELSSYITDSHVALAEINTLRTAAAIKLVMDESLTEPRLALPVGVNDTYELASNTEQLQNYFSDIRKVAELKDKYDSILQETKTNPATLNALSTDPELYVADLAGAVQVEFSTSSENVSFDFNTDGSGSFKLKKVEHNFSWQNTTSLQIDFDNALIDTYFPRKDIGGTFTEVERQTIYDSIEINLVATLGHIDLVRYQVNWHHHYPNNEFPDEVQTPFDQVTYMFKDYAPITVDEVLGKRAIPLYADLVGPKYNETPSLEMGFFTFSEDNSVTFEVPEGAIPNLNFDAGTWTLTEGGALMLIFDAVKLEVRRLDNDYFVVYATDASDQYISFSMDMSVLKSVDTLWSAADIAGVYHEPEVFMSEYLDYYGFKLNVDGTGQTINGEDDDENGVLELTEYYTSPITWVLQDGNLVINETDTVRTIDLLKIDGEQYHAVERYQYGSAPSFDEDDITYNVWIKSDSSPID